MRAVAVVAVLALVLGVAFAAPPRWFELDGYTFDQYVLDYNKPYAPGTDEYTEHKARFDAELASVMKHNRQPSVSYKRGINTYSDYSDEELKVLRGSTVGSATHLIDELDKKYKVHQTKGGAIPASLDYRDVKPSIITAVKDQGNCGSCWAHAATETIESHWAMATGNLFVLSQQEITSCTPNPKECGGTGGCAGNIPEQAVDYLVQAGGVTQEWQYPYVSYFGTTPKCRSNLKQRQVKVTGYYKAEKNNQTSVLDALVHGGPVTISVDASHWSSYESGVFTGCHYAKNISMDHSVVVVGYGHDAELKMDYWTVRNSWSPHWGEHGYIRLLKEDKPKCGWNVHPTNGDGCKGGPPQQWTCGECAILYDVMYPEVPKP